ncbi:MAG: class I SAM-dependent methyltransferase [Actinomycetes bacterium]
MTRHTFDHVASDYDAARPDYPAPLFDALESALGQPLLRADVLDVGAGTGIATRALAGRGANVVAVDPGPGVLSVLRSRSTSRVRPVVGDGNALPLRDGVFDLVTYAQSWHWTDPARSVPEAVRVLHDRGVLAVWWNLLVVDGLDWWRDMVAAVERFGSAYDHTLRDADWGAAMSDSGLFRWVRRVEVPWTRTVSAEDLVTDYGSHSYVADLPPAARAEVLAGLRRSVHETYPGGVASLAYVTRLWVARR